MSPTKKRRNTAKLFILICCCCRLYYSRLLEPLTTTTTTTTALTIFSKSFLFLWLAKKQKAKERTSLWLPARAFLTWLLPLVFHNYNVVCGFHSSLCQKKKGKERRGKQHTNLMGGVRTISVFSLSLSFFLMVEEETMTIVSDTGSIRST